MSVFDLNGEWRLTSPEHPEISVPCQIPGDNHSALIDAGIIPEPYIGCDEKEVQWVGRSRWIMSKTILVSEQDLSLTAIDLTLSRVDTMASMRINGKPVLECSNMFKKHKLDIRPHLKLGENLIQIIFSRADLEAEVRAKRLPFPIPYSKGNNKIPHMNTVRKAQCHAGWDWGICLMVSGIYEPIKADVIHQTRLHEIDCKQRWLTEDLVSVSVTVSHDEYCCDLRVALGDQTISTRTESNQAKTTVEFMVSDPQRWWPAGYGEQPLYPLIVELDGQVIEKKLGLRELEVETKKDLIGSAFTIKVNGCPITAKGANWIPMDALPSRESSARYRQLLESAVDANMNMIRVWGGGQYESDTFYQLCDELGLLVWQDMMFACSLYPSTDEFLYDVESEVRHQIKRLKHHACIALWCGDNEVIGAIGWYDESRDQREKYTVNYDRLSRHLVNIIDEEDDTRLFWPSSPCNGELDYGDAWHDDKKGDMHFWDVWHSGKSFETYRDVTPRFCSEFGFQSWPSFAEVKQFVPEKDWNITSPTFENHQKNPRGNSIIAESFTRYFRFPTGFENMLYLSQVQQAMAIQTACDHWRSVKPVCRGMLFWQLNDNWPVSSWSSIEYSGRWKQLHYRAKRFFAPLYVAFVDKREKITLRALNDARETAKLEGKVSWINWHGEVLKEWTVHTTVEADGNQHIWEFSKKELNPDIGFLHISFNQEEIESSWFSELPKNLPLENSDIEIKITANQIELTSDKPAFYVHLEHDGQGRFSDSSFTLLANQPKVIEYIGDDRATMAETLRVYHLAGSH